MFLQGIEFLRSYISESGHSVIRHFRESLKGAGMGSGAAVPSTSIGTNTIQKMRLRILPFVFLLYVIAQLDRNNIGSAALTMNQELAIISLQYGLIFGIFFFGYLLFEIPSNLLLHKIGARLDGPDTD
jgi:hypothetical protein